MIKIISCFFSVFILFIIFSCFNGSYAQFESHPELDWYTIETTHFTISYHKGTERTAGAIAKICEEIYGPITSLYDYEPKDKVNFIVNDVSDIANGATDYFNNRIEILATALDFDLRGTHNWLRNVVTHEFTHIIQIQASMKLSTKFPAIYLQWLNYEKERRPDVLYGYPNVIVSYPISGVGVPAWFAEGTAQYQRQEMGYDQWDSHRDMILRMYVTDDDMLSYNEMGQFSSITSLKAESIYNSGFALVRYISQTYGEDKLKEISNNLSDLTNFSIDRAFRQCLGIDGTDLYDNWKKFLQQDYEKRLLKVKSNIIEGDIIEKKGFANYYPHYSPDGSKIAFLSNQDYDYASTSLYLYDVAKKEKKLITFPAGTNLSWSPDGKKIIYSRRNYPPTINDVIIFDVYEYDITTEKEKRITNKLRAISPSYSSDGKSICFLVNGDGTMNLYTADVDGKNIFKLTDFNDGEQLFNPVFSFDGKNIFLDYALENGRRIMQFNIEDKKLEPVFNESFGDTRSSFLSSDGKKLFFSSNRTGIFNIYSYDIQSKDIKQITNVPGGAFMPSVDNNGNLVYSSYTSTGYKISVLKSFKETEINPDRDYNRPDKLISKYHDLDSLTNEKKDNFDWKYLRNFDDKNTTIKNANPYTSIFTNIAFFPVIRFDNYTKDYNFLDAIKPGFYFYSDEMLSRFSIFGGANVNRKGERDLFFQFQYDNGVPFLKDFFAKQLNFEPKFSIEAYNISRQSSGQLIAGTDTINVGVTYDLLEFDIGMIFKMFNINHEFRFNYSFSKYASDIDGFLIPQSNIAIPASAQDYFKAHTLSLSYSYENYYPNRNMDINPVGRRVRIKYDFEMSKINPAYVVDNNGNLSTVYQNNKLHKIDAEWLESIGLFNNQHSVSLKVRGATIFGPRVDEFYAFYATGLPGMKGYPFYALGGGKVLTGNLTYRIPVLTKIDTRISPLYLDKLYFSIYGDYGDAWDGNDITLKDFKKDMGAELRLQAFSFYAFPTSIFLNAAYGFDEFTKRFRGENVTYGKEWRFYFGVLFGFDF